MYLQDLIAQIQSQLEKLANQEKINQKEQEVTNQRIQTLETEIKEQYHRQSQLDDEAIQLYCQGEYLQTKLEKLTKIASLSQEFRDLHAECQDNQELLETLYSSISQLEEEESIHIDPQIILNNNQQPIDDDSLKTENGDRPEADFQTVFESFNTPSPHASIADPPQEKEEEQPEEKQNQDEPNILTLQHIKTVLPNAELIYKKLIVRNLEKYRTYHNLIIDELDVIWCSVAFIAFGRIAYRQLSFKHHPDLNGSDEAMQLINTAWEISEEYLAETVNSNQ